MKMSHLNSKTIVQEWCQKLCFPLPVYDTVFVGGESHDPQFVSTITVGEENIKGEICSSRKKAELSAAEKTLEVLKIESVNFSKSVSSAKNACVLIDLENVGCWNALQNTNFNSSIIVILFVGKLHPYASICVSEKYEIIIVDSCVKDAVDIAIVGKAVEFLSEVDEVVILSRDHFAGALSDCVKQGLFKGNLYHATTYGELVSHFT